MMQLEVQARPVHDCGRMPGEWFYSHFIYGSNYRLSEWQGAILNVQLSRLDEQTKRRHQNSRLLDRLLREIPGITPQKLDERCTRNGQYAYIFHVNKNKFAGLSTERFIEAMNAEGIPNQAVSPPAPRVAHVPQWRVPQAPQRKAGQRQACVPEEKIPGDTKGGLGNRLDSAARVAGR